MSEPARAKMDSDTFIAWAMEQPEGARYELFAGEIVPKPAERVAHGRAKGQIFRALADAVEAAGLQCEVFVDGISVPIDEHTTYEPDVLLRCGKPLDGSQTRVSDPVVVVEVASPSSRARDVGAKLADYFRLPSLHHYVIVRAEDRTVVQHSRQPGGTIQTTIRRNGPVELSPPGLTLARLLPA